MKALIMTIVGNIASKAWVVGSELVILEVKRGNTIRRTTMFKIPLKISLVLLFLVIVTSPLLF